MVKLKFLQLNMGRGEAAMALLFRKIKREKFDVVLVQEPCAKLDKLSDFEIYRPAGAHAKVVTMVRKVIGRVWVKRCDCESENVVTVELERLGNGRNIVVVNVYDEPPGPRNADSKFRAVSGWVQSARGRMIVAGDFNGKNVMWGGTVTDERGREIHEWTVSNGFRIENDPADAASFCSNRGRSWPDFVIARDARVADRRVDEEDESMSDHRYITYDVEMDASERRQSVWRYDVRRVNWERFERKVKERCERVEVCGLATEDAWAFLQGVVSGVCKEEMRRRRRNGRDGGRGRVENERKTKRGFGQVKKGS